MTKIIRYWTRILTIVTITISLILCNNGIAVAEGVQIVRDSEVESIIRTYATPLWRVAGLQPEAITVNIVNDNTANAFVAGGQNIFITTGLLMRVNDASQLIGVVAHETGHIARGDLAKIPQLQRDALITSLLIMAIGGAAAAATGNASMGAAGATLGPSVAGRNYFAFSRGIESAADQAGVSYLDKVHESARGLLNFLEIIENQEAISASHQDPYMRTHPVTLERVNFIREHVMRSPWSNELPKQSYQDLFARMRAKLDGFFKPPQTVLKLYPDTDTSVSARYARAIAYYRIPKLDQALPIIDSLISDEPENPYFYELKGQMLFENGRLSDAIAPYRRASELLPNSALIQIETSQAEIETEDPNLLNIAINRLNNASQKDPSIPLLWRLLAVGYGRRNDFGLATSAKASGAQLTGDYIMAVAEARKAMRLLPMGSPAWLRAQDIEQQAIDSIKRSD